jgi:uncharacterized protein YecE (DUF72 family)
MKFGSVPEEQLQHLPLTLPEEPEENRYTLKGQRVPNPKVYIGAAVWGDTSWAGTIYPPKTPATKFRQFYPKQFNCIELNATHYTIYSPDVLQQWASAAKEKDFKFCPKFPQQISHHSGFVQTEVLTHSFLESIRALEENLGPVFLQVSEFFPPSNRALLFQYLDSLPKDISSFLEVRHPDWFSKTDIREELFAVLQSLNMGAVITDAPGRRDIVHMRLTVPKLFLRFVCNGLHPSSFARADEWAGRLAYWLDQGLEEAFIFLHPGNDASVPELARYWIEKVNGNCGLQLKPPTPLQPLLFT